MDIHKYVIIELCVYHSFSSMYLVVKLPALPVLKNTRQWSTGLYTL